MPEPMFVTEIVEKVPDKYKDILKEAGEEAQFIRKTMTVVEKSWEFDEGERAEVGYISTSDIDRDAEILVPSGCNLREFNKAPQVLWGHDYNQPPIGKALWAKVDSKQNPKGIIAKTVYANTERAEEIWQLVKGGFLKTFSVGFVPLKFTWQGAEDWEKTCDKLHADGMSFDRTKVNRIYTKWLLLEYSKVSVPANINALTVAVAKNKFTLSKELKTQLSLDEEEVKKIQDEIHKAVIPYKDMGSAPESAEWDGPEEVRKSDVETLKLICAWYDRENEDIKSSYKLPHHRAEGRHAAVWRGVAAAMGALLGGRGGVDMPSSDKKGCYNHLKQHYSAWDKEPPEFREYCDAELKIIFAGNWDDILYLNYPALKPYPNEHACRLLSPDGWDKVTRQNDKFGKGIHAIWGIKDNKSHLQAIRFSKSEFTAAQARKWCKDHDYDCILFEPASESRAEELQELNASVELHGCPVSVTKVAEPVKEKIEVVEIVEIVRQVEIIELEVTQEPIVELVEKELGRKLGKV